MLGLSRRVLESGKRKKFQIKKTHIGEEKKHISFWGKKRSGFFLLNGFLRYKTPLRLKHLQGGREQKRPVILKNQEGETRSKKEQRKTATTLTPDA